MLLGTIGIHSAYSVYSKLPYNPDKDLQPVIVLGGVPCVVAVHPSKPMNSLAELIAYAKEPRRPQFRIRGHWFLDPHGR